MGERVLVTGGTGVLGRVLVPQLRRRGMAVRVLSRRPAPPADDDWATADLRTGAGLGQALTDVGTVVHCATSPRGDVPMTARLLDALHDGATAGGPRPAPHLVFVSIVGVDRVPFGYYRRKLAGEELIEASGVPWTVVRATQFHDFIAGMLQRLAWSPVLVVPEMRVQPVDAADVAVRVADAVEAGPRGRTTDVAGPELRDARDLAVAYLRATGRRRAVVDARMPGAAFRAVRAGHNVAPDGDLGTVRFEQWLERRYAGLGW